MFDWFAIGSAVTGCGIAWAAAASDDGGYWWYIAPIWTVVTVGLIVMVVVGRRSGKA